MAYYLKVDGYPFPDRGVIPDYEVKPTIEDLLTGNDKIMDYTLKRILK
jgi:C-terminal processing protease CtpA/Prc